MKYLFIVVTIVCAVSIATLIAVWPRHQTIPADTVITINGHAISRQHIQDFRAKESHHGDRQDAINDLITQQLLIAEAQRRNIDKEPGFRTALKTYYEHSLIKILMDRVARESSVTVTDEEVENYVNSYGRTFTFFTLETTDEVDGDVIRSQGEQHTALFEDLSEPLQMVLAGMQPGDSGSTYITGNDKMWVSLTKIEGQSTHSQNFDKEIIRQRLHQAKIEKHINDWIEKLHHDASITYHTSQE